MTLYFWLDKWKSRMESLYHYSQNFAFLHSMQFVLNSSLCIHYSIFKNILVGTGFTLKVNVTKQHSQCMFVYDLIWVHIITPVYLRISMTCKENVKCIFSNVVWHTLPTRHHPKITMDTVSPQTFKNPFHLSNSYSWPVCSCTRNEFECLFWYTFVSPLVSLILNIAFDSTLWLIIP